MRRSNALHLHLLFCSQNDAGALETTDDVTVAKEPNASVQSLKNAFTVKDLSSLVKNLEAEILTNEQHLNDENDKRNMFKVSRRPFHIG